MTKRKTYHHGDLRRALLTSSVDLLRESGKNGFTLREVARRAGVSHTAPYRHFRDKADLLAALAEEGFERLTSAVHSAAARGGSPFERLQYAGIAYVEFAMKQPEHFSVMFSADLSNGPENARAAAERCFGALVQLVAACQDGRSGDQSAETAARIAWTQVHGVAELALHGQLPFTNKKQLREFTMLATAAIGSGLKLKGQRREG